MRSAGAPVDAPSVTGWSGVTVPATFRGWQVNVPVRTGRFSGASAPVLEAACGGDDGARRVGHRERGARRPARDAHARPVGRRAGAAEAPAPGEDRLFAAPRVAGQPRAGAGDR